MIEGFPGVRPTFLDLPEAKRARFTLAARDLFAASPYDAASITRLVQELGIAKGSVYQYFDGKLGLYAWLVEQAVQRRVDGLAGLTPPAGGLWERLRFGYRAGLAFHARNPQWVGLILRLRDPSEEPGVARLRAWVDQRAHAGMVDLLRAGQSDGSVRPDLDLAATAHLMRGLLADGLLSAFLDALGITEEQLRSAALTDAQLACALPVADQAIDLLERALKR